MDNRKRRDFASEFQHEAAIDHRFAVAALADGCIASAISEQNAARASARRAQHALTAELHRIPAFPSMEDLRHLESLLSYAGDGSTVS